MVVLQGFLASPAPGSAQSCPAPFYSRSGWLQVLTFKLHGLAEMRAALSDFSDRRFRAAVSTSLTRSARQMKADWQEQIDRRIDRPIARTQSATVFTSATAATLQAEVKVKDQMTGTPPATYLNPQERSGGRTAKKFEQALISSGVMPRGYITVPGRGAQLDAYGNVSKSQIIAVIAALGANYSPGYQRVISTSTAKRLATLTRRGGQYISVHPDDAKTLGVSAGIYEKTSGKTLKAVFLYRRAVRYRKILDLEALAAKEGPRIIGEEFARAVNESFARLRAQQASTGG